MVMEWDNMVEALKMLPRHMKDVAIDFEGDRGFTNYRVMEILDMLPRGYNVTELSFGKSWRGCWEPWIRERFNL